MADPPAADGLSPASVNIATAAAPVANTPARDRVLGLPELVENILSFLSPEDILRARRVSKLWYSQYVNSKRIRRLAVLTPITCEPEVRFRQGPYHSYMLSHGSQTCCMPHYAGDYYGDDYPITVHPLINYGAIDKEEFEGWEEHHKHGIEFNNPRYENQRNDFATDPPCSTLGVGLSYFWSEHEDHCIVHNPEGLRLGEIMDTVHKMLEPASGDVPDAYTSKGVPSVRMSYDAWFNGPHDDCSRRLSSSSRLSVLFEFQREDKPSWEEERRMAFMACDGGVSPNNKSRG